MVFLGDRLWPRGYLRRVDISPRLSAVFYLKTPSGVVCSFESVDAAGLSCVRGLVYWDSIDCPVCSGTKSFCHFLTIPLGVEEDEVGPNTESPWLRSELETRGSIPYSGSRPAEFYVEQIFVRLHFTLKKDS